MYVFLASMVFAVAISFFVKVHPSLEKLKKTQSSKAAPQEQADSSK